MPEPVVLPSYYDDLDLTAEEIWQRLARGASDRRSAFHTAAVASVREDAPEVRIMVLREADRSSRLLRFHTDVRTHKAQEIGRAAPVSVLLYDARAKIQVRVRGAARIENAGPIADLAWSRTPNFGRRCYLATHAPGALADHGLSGLPPEIEGIEPTEAQTEPGRPNFAVLLITMTGLEWLYLANAGHRRARFDWHDDDWHATWLVP